MERRISTKFSAYLSIYNDWDILEYCLNSIKSHVNELVVVDGAYEWMAPYFQKIGCDPLRSDQRVYDILHRSGVPFRVISGLWKNEIEKRRAGFDACSYRYIYRIDADEVLFFRDNDMEEFLVSGCAVAEMEMPLYLAPGWIRREKDAENIERQCFLFDREKISSDIHLNYLWLVLTADVLPQAGLKPYPIYPKPLAFNAHLAEWRTYETAVNRAAFYSLNFVRQNGLPWLPSLAARPVADLNELFNVVPPGAFLEILEGSRLVTGNFGLENDFIPYPTPLTTIQEANFNQAYDNLLVHHMILNSRLAEHERHFVTGQPVTIDISTPSSLAAITQTEDLTLEFSTPIYAANTRLRYLTSDIPGIIEHAVDHEINGRQLNIKLSHELINQNFLRRSLQFQVWALDPRQLHRFRTMKQ